MDEALKQHAETVASALNGLLKAQTIAHGELTITVAPSDIVAAVRYLLNAPRVTGEILTVDAGQRGLK